ncbi:uncharacterized protein LOC110440531 [Mizuhopecten yessoensis]|uniref:Nose resistant to fluoxetine protein 6 n=1 Tax=Mizuhopecten yessoensis TaxID=6573 RepID=A0A210PL14_MIZYE|nr:uncharacterized protein LOC110440531 [Mizuhopecten yessoensis]OWF37179.1 Nose resistant to fluoxetine protein 6 [Mizuhopecten yessoensis]
MKIAAVSLVIGALLLMTSSPVAGQLDGLSIDLIEGLNDSQVVALVADILLRNPALLHRLEPIPFAIGPVLNEISKLRIEISSSVLNWILDSLPAWLNNPDFLTGVHCLVNNIKKVNITDLVATQNYTILMYGVVARTEYSHVIEDFLMAEGANITKAIGLDQHIAEKLLPFVVHSAGTFLRQDGPALIRILVQEFNMINRTGLETLNGPRLISAILTRINYSELFGKLYQLPSVKGIVHTGFQVIGLDPALGDKLVPELFHGLEEIVNITIGQINQLNLTALAGLYKANITDVDLLHEINYLDILKSTFLPKIGSLVLKYVRESAVGVLKLFVEELNLVPKKNVLFFLLNPQTLSNVLEKFDWGEFLTKLLENFGKPVFDLVGLNPVIGKVLAPVIAKDLPNLLKFTIQDLNKIDVSLVENPPNGTSPLVVIVKELDVANILHEFVKLKGLQWDDIMGLNTGIALMLLDWTSERVVSFLKNETYNLLSIFIEEVKQVDTAGLDPSNAEEYAGGIMSRLAWSKMLSTIIGDQKDLVFSLLNLDSLKTIDTESITRLMQPVLGVLPNVLAVVSDSLSDANFTNIPANASVLDILRQVNIKTLWQDTINMILPPKSASNQKPKYNLSLRSAALQSKDVQEIAPTCGPDTRGFLLNAISESWAMEMLDASGKPTPGLLKGSLHMMGSYDECLAIKADLLTEENTTRSFGGRYCRVAFDLPKSLLVSLLPNLATQKLYGMKTTVSIGVCLPDSCVSQDVNNFFENGMASGLGLSPLSVTCNESEDLASDQSAILVLAISAAIILLVGAATITHLCKWGRGQTNGMPSGMRMYEDYNNHGYDAYESADPDTDSKTTTTTTTTTTSFSNGSVKGDLLSESTKLKNRPETKTDLDHQANGFDDLNRVEFTKTSDIGKRIVLSFSAVQSISQLMSYRRAANAIDCIHGIRTISILWIMLGNTYIYNILPVTDSPLAVDMLDALEIMKRFTFQAVMGAHYGIDTFLLISGCLITYRILSKFEKFEKFKWKTLLGVFFHRYIRLTPTYIMVLVIFVYWYRYLGTGPSWPESIAVADKCRTDWWHHILYINNLVGIQGNDAFHQCMTWSFFLALLMQFYLITPILLLLATFSYRLAGAVIFLLMAAGITATGIKEHEFGGDLLSMMEDHGDYWNNVFVAPWCRISSYCIGMMLALVIMKSNEGKIKKLPLWSATIGWITAIIIGVFVVYINYTKYQPDVEEWTRDMEAAYEAIGRPLWCLCVAWVIYACFTGRGGLINSFLSWRGFLPLSRLTFAVYLVHPIWMVFFMYTKRDLVYLLNDYGMTYLFIGHSVMSFGIAFLVAVLFEKPFCNLARAVFKNK